MNDLIGIYGASGFGREVLPLVKKQHPLAEILFIDDNKSVDILNGIKVVDFNEFSTKENQRKKVCIAIADSKIRELLQTKLDTHHIQTLNIQAENIVIMDEVHIQDGFILSPFITLTSNINIGKNFHANIYSYVAHDCVIGDFVTFAPSVKCNGNVHIEDHAYIGTGAIIKQGTPKKPIVIGKGAIVGMGAVVTKSVAAGTVVVGNPAKPLGKQLGK